MNNPAIQDAAKAVLSDTKFSLGEHVQCMLGLVTEYQGKPDLQAAREFIEAVLTRVCEDCEPEQVIL